MEDEITKAALTVVSASEEPLETKEIESNLRKTVADVTRTKLFYRLNNLRGEGKIKGKFLGPGKGVWVWWKKDAFR
ncbi:MAG: hypothetical protein ISS93_02700 [Candidatus Aenigmarchaeota archaeon]|nr:hypothetical protein [Candidatus Aenigmarchaeota archaeon]